jgi:hypothetical protein
MTPTPQRERSPERVDASASERRRGQELATIGPQERVRSVASSVVVVVVAVTALVLVVAGCGVVEAMLDSEEALQREGFSNPSVGLESANGSDFVNVTYDAGPHESVVDNDLAAAAVIWRTVPYRFDRVVIDGRAYTRFRLERELGARDPALDEETISHELRDIGIRALLIVAAIGIAVIGTIILIVVLVVRSRKRHTMPMFSAAVRGPGDWTPPPRPRH